MRASSRPRARRSAFWPLCCALGSSPGRKPPRLIPRKNWKRRGTSSKGSARRAATWPRRSPNRTGRSTRCSAKSRRCARNRKRSRQNWPQKEAELKRATEALEAEEAHLGAGAGEAATGDGGAERAAGRDLRDGLAGHAQRDPRVRRLDRDGRPDRIPAPDPGIRRRGRRPGEDSAQRGRARRSSGSTSNGPRSKRRATRSPPRSAKSPPPAPKPQARFAELKAEQAERQEALDALQSREAALSNNLSVDLRTDRLRRRRRHRRQDAGAAQPRPGSAADHRKRSERPGLGPAGGQGSRSPPPTRSRRRPTSGAAATAPSNPRATTARARSASPCTAAACWKARSTRPASRPGANPGRARWITVYANASHAWMVVAGISFDTIGGAGPRWHDPWATSPEGFVARHPAGLERAWPAHFGVLGRSCAEHTSSLRP